MRAHGDVIVREGIGSGFARAPSAEAAHDIALKAAETDATKRALATFGNPFGLALYDKNQAGVTRPTQAPSREMPKYTLRRDDSTKVLFDLPGDFTDAMLAAIRVIDSVDALYAFWERNRGGLAALTRTVKGSNKAVVQADTIVAAFKAQAQILGRVLTGKDGALAFPKEGRIRNKEHLKFVARQACLICGRRPTHAHHVRFAQTRALGMVSDEFTVPLCSVHHDAVHRTGNERSWWMSQAIDPLKAAAQLWAATQGKQTQGDGPQAKAVEALPAADTSPPSELAGDPHSLTSRYRVPPLQGKSPTPNLRTVPGRKCDRARYREAVDPLTHQP